MTRPTNGAARTRVGFIGAGIIASRHLGDLLDFPDVRVVAVADPLLDRARDLAGRADARPYVDATEMLDKEELDAVYVCVPPFAHGAPERALVERGVPFFVEKPLSVDFLVAEEIARGVSEKGLVTGVGYHWRYLDIVERAQELLAAHPAHLALGYWLDGTPPPAWWAKQALSGGQMVEQTTHIFDLARLLVGEVDTVYAAGKKLQRPAHPDADILDVSAATLHFASGALGTMHSADILAWPHRIGLHLFGEGLAVELTEFELMVDRGKGRPVQKAQGDPFVREDRDFIDAVQGKEDKIRVPYAQALETHRLVTTAARAAVEGRELPVGGTAVPPQFRPGRQPVAAGA